MFQKATVDGSFARIGLLGLAGVGKTYTSLILGTELAKCMGKRAAVIDSEHKSSKKYAKQFDFDAVYLSNHDPREYIRCIKAAEAAGYGALIIDSLTHAWAGTRGALELLDEAKDKHRGNKFSAWRDISPIHNELIDTLLNSNMHIIATMRVKTKYVLETNDKGKQEPRKIGLAPIQREGLEYEFDIVGDIDLNHNLIFSKSRCPAFAAGATVNRPGAEIAQVIDKWLSAEVSPEPTDYERRLAALGELGVFATNYGVDGQMLRSYGAECPDVRNADPKQWSLDDCEKIKAFIEFKFDPSNEGH